MFSGKLEDLHSWEELGKKIIVTALIEPDIQDEFMEWFKSKEPLGYLFNDALLWKHCFYIAKKLKKDGDHFIVVCGKEGIGKSTLASQICAVISPTFSRKNICFKLSQFIDGLKNSNKGDSFQLDEGSLFLFSYEAMSQESRMAKKLFTIMRVKNLQICICIPNFFIIDQYIRNHRVDTLVYVWDRGSHTVFQGKAIKIISQEGKEFKTIDGIRVPYGTFWKGNFRKDMPVINDLSTELYQQHKIDNVNEFIDEMGRMANELDTAKYITVKDAMKIYPVSEFTIKRLLKTGKLRGISNGGKWLVERKSIDDLAFVVPTPPLTTKHNGAKPEKLPEE